MDFVLPVEGDMLKGLDTWTEKAALGRMDYGLHVAVTSWSTKVAADMREAVERGVNSFKFFLAYKARPRSALSFPCSDRRCAVSKNNGRCLDSMLPTLIFPLVALSYRIVTQSGEAAGRLPD